MKIRHLAYGLCVALSVLPTDAEGGPWTTIAYEAELKGYRLADGTHARITSKDIDDMVKNFGRYPKAPIVVEHADTREGMPAEWATPRGHVVALRRGTFTRTLPDGTTKAVASLEARLDTSPEVRLSIVGDAETKTPPTWPFCSITTAKGTDEETGAALGTVLYSVSLTAHPRLKDLPRLAASQDPRAPKGELGYLWLPEGDVAFIDAMVPHHEMAVAMARHVVERGSDAAVKALAQRIITAQTAEISAMRAARRELTGAENAAYPEAYESDMIEMLARHDGAALDAMFLAGMIPHHASAIVMADGAIPHLARADLREMAKGIVAAQTAEIVEMHALRAAATESMSMSRGAPAPITRPKEGKSMKTFLELAAAMKLTAVATEDDAQRAVLSLAQDGATVREVLGLKPETTVAAELATITAERTELGKLRAEVKDLRAESEKRAEAELSRRVEEVLVAEGAVGDEKRARALTAYARADRAGFDRDYPAPSVQELAQRAQDSARLENITGEHGTAAKAAKGADPAKKLSAEEHVTALVAVYAEHGVQITRVEALRLHISGETADKARAAFAQTVAR